MYKPFEKEHILIAHRGYRAYYPENTLFAFKEAVLNGFDMFEFDVQYTKDKVPIVFHDDDLLRITDVRDVFSKESYKIKDYTYEEIKKLDNVSWFIHSNPFNVELDYAGLEKLPKHSIAHLDEVLELIKNYNFPANLEIKPSYLKDEFVIKDILGRIEKFGIKHLILISSFNHNYIKKIDGFYKAALFENKKTELIKYLLSLKVDSYHIDKEDADEKIISALKQKGVFTNVYTVDDKKEQKTLFNMGVKGVFCDI